jgi:8-oxo-dGTP pyrophosphatase MutT (NUDIX family)
VEHFNLKLSSTGALIYCTQTNRYLFLLRNGKSHSGSWGIVGGKVEPGETIVEGLHREIREELGGEIKDAKIIPIEQYTSDNGKFEFHTYLISVDEEFVPVLNEEHRGYCWVPLEDYPKPLHPGVWRSFKFSAITDKIHATEKALTNIGLNNKSTIVNLS